MSDLIKKFIQQHRTDFDASAPGAHGWRGVEQVLQRWTSADGLEKTVLLNRLLLDTEMPRACVWEHISATLDGKTGPSDPLECFIFEHRDEMDLAIPDLRVWGNIEQTVPARSATIVVRVDWQRRLLRAAASVALLVTGMGLGLWYAGHSEAGQSGGMAMGEVSAEYRELEGYYQRDIAGKQEKLATFTGNQPDEIESDLVQMDKAMEELRQELADVPPGNREQVVRAMIENYKAKAAILQRVLQSLEEATPTQQQNNKPHENARI